MQANGIEQVSFVTSSGGPEPGLAQRARGRRADRRSSRAAPRRSALRHGASVRQAKPGRGGFHVATAWKKPSDGTQRVRVPSGKGGLPAGSESCVVHGRPWLRSVDSERVGRVIEPRKRVRCREPTLSKLRKAIPGSQEKGPGPKRPCFRVPPGSKEHGTYVRVPQEPGRSRRLRANGSAKRTRGSVARRATRSPSSSWYPRSWGTHPRGPSGGTGLPTSGTAGGKDDGDVALRDRLNAT